MSVCGHRHESCGFFVACARRDTVNGVVEVHVCECAAEVKDEQPETRAARVPDSAREGA